MHITVICPNCQKRYQLDPQLEGKNIRCPNPVCREIIQVQGVIEPEEAGSPGEPIQYEGSEIVPEDIGIVEIPEDNPMKTGRRPPVPGKYSTGKVGDMIPILPARESPRRPIEPPKGKYPPPTPSPSPRSLPPAEREEEVVPREPVPRREVPSRREPPPRRERPRRDRRSRRLSDTEELETSPPVAPAAEAPESPRQSMSPVTTEAEPDAGLNWMDAPPPVRSQQDQSGTLSGPVSADYSATAEYGPATEPYPTGVATYDQHPPSKRRRARWIILTLFGIVTVSVALAAFIIVKATTASENKRFASAKKDYDEGKFAAARENFDELRNKFPKSERAEVYDFLAALSEVRDQVYRTNPESEEALKQLRQFTKHRAGDPLLGEYKKDVWQTYQRSIEDATTLAEQKLTPPANVELARRLLSECRTAWEEAKAFAPKDQPSEPSKKFAERFTKLEQAVAKQEKRNELLAQLKSSPPSPDNILRLERQAQAEGLQEDTEIQERIKELKNQLISHVSYEPSPSVPPSRGVSEPAHAGLLITPRLEISGAAAIAGNGVVLALARGVLYALAEKDGSVLWATRCGVDMSRLPVRLPASETASETLLVLSSETNTLTARDLVSGRILWHYDLQSPCLGQPVVIGRRAYVPTLDGKVHEIETVTGHLLGWYKLGLPLTVGGAHLPGSNLVYFPADSLNVYVLNVSRQKCVGILQSGHAPGTLRSDPILVGGFDTMENNPNAAADARLLVLSQADDLATTRLRAFPLPVEGATPVSALQPEPRIRGWSWFQPKCDGERIALATDGGVLGLFGLQQKGNDDKAIFPEGNQEISLGVSPGSPLRAEVIHMIDDDLWVLVNGNLQMVHFDKYRQKVVPIWDRPLTLGSPLHESQVDEKNKTLFTVTQSLTRQTCLATAVSLENGRVRWQRQLGMVCQGDPVLLGSEIVCLDQGGALLRFDSGGIPNASESSWQTGGELLAVSVENLDGEAVLIAGGDGRSVLEVACVQKRTQHGERGFSLLVRRYEAGKNLTEMTFPLKSARLAGTPALMGGSLLVPLDDGSLLRQPLDGSPGSFGPGWRARTADEGARGHVIALNAEDFLTSDGSRGLTRWHWPAGDPVYKEEQRVDLPQRIISAPTLIRGQKSTSSPSPPGEEGGARGEQESEAKGQKPDGGELICMADAAGLVRLLRASDLKQEVRRWDLSQSVSAESGAGEPGGLTTGAARLTAGPFVRGNQVGCVVHQRRLIWLDPGQDKPLWEYTTPGAGIVGQPQRIGNLILVADLTGRFIGLDSATGKSPWPAGYMHVANVAPAATGVPFGPDRAFVPLTDGTVFFLSLNHLRPPAKQ